MDNGYSFSIGSLEIFFAAVTFLGGIAVTFVSMAIRDAVLKNTFKHRLTALESDRKEREHYSALKEKADDEYNKAQDSRIQRNSNDILTMRENLQNSRENFDKFYREYREELKENRTITNDLNKTLAGLDASVKGLGNLIEIISKDLRDVKRTK